MTLDTWFVLQRGRVAASQVLTEQVARQRLKETSTDADEYQYSDRLYSATGLTRSGGIVKGHGAMGWWNGRK